MRGEGFELRTDHAGVSQVKAIHPQRLFKTNNPYTLRTKEAIQNFTESLESMKALSEYAVSKKLKLQICSKILINILKRLNHKVDSKKKMLMPDHPEVFLF